MTKKSHGFTVIELIFIIVVVGIASVIFFVQKNNLQLVADDSAKKTAINAMLVIQINESPAPVPIRCGS